MLSQEINADGVQIRPVYVAFRYPEDGRMGNRWKERFYRRDGDGQLVAMTDSERDQFLLENPEVITRLLEMRAVSAELRADHAEHRLHEVQCRVAELEHAQAVGA